MRVSARSVRTRREASQIVSSAHVTHCEVLMKDEPAKTLANHCPVGKEIRQKGETKLPLPAQLVKDGLSRESNHLPATTYCKLLAHMAVSVLSACPATTVRYEKKISTLQSVQLIFRMLRLMMLCAGDESTLGRVP